MVLLPRPMARIWPPGWKASESGMAAGISGALRAAGRVVGEVDDGLAVAGPIFLVGLALVKVKSVPEQTAAARVAPSGLKA